MYIFLEINEKYFPEDYQLFETVKTKDFMKKLQSGKKYISVDFNN